MTTSPNPGPTGPVPPPYVPPGGAQHPQPPLTSPYAPQGAPASQQQPYGQPPPQAPGGLYPQPARPVKKGGASRWLIPIGAGVLGLVIGAAAGGGGGDPTESAEYRGLEEQVVALEGDVDEANRAAAEAADLARADAEADLAEREAAVTEAEAAVTAREQAVAGVEAAVAANSVGQGIWTVGVDVVPGTYRTSEAVAGECYWGIYTSGTNLDDIVDNAIVTGGFPTVVLSEGQDFENNGCGTFVLQP